jgi:hypothetical protein
MTMDIGSYRYEQPGGVGGVGAVSELTVFRGEWYLPDSDDRNT